MLILLSFMAYLRPGEALKIKGKDLVEPVRGSGTSHWALLIAPAEDNIGTKTIADYPAYAALHVHTVTIPGCPTGKDQGKAQGKDQGEGQLLPSAKGRPRHTRKGPWAQLPRQR